MQFKTLKNKKINTQTKKKIEPLNPYYCFNYYYQFVHYLFFHSINFIHYFFFFLSIHFKFYIIIHTHRHIRTYSKK